MQVHYESMDMRQRMKKIDWLLPIFELCCPAACAVLALLLAALRRWCCFGVAARRQELLRVACCGWLRRLPA